MTLFALARLAIRKKPRTDWKERWQAAGRAVGWLGAFRYGEHGKYKMVARPDSPIWNALAFGHGGFGDATGDGTPPFAFNSGLGWLTINYELPNSNKP